ncbi:MAG: LPS export ABC transporter periplasmic protein LptC [Treponema sp.]|nr:LPS export ABC transporter periplasmic protein LptC [Treponema sp.]
MSEKNGSTLLLILIFVFFSACTLKYEDTVAAESKNPEFVFFDTQLMRYEGKRKTVDVEAETIERYKDSNSNYAKNVKFKTFDNQNQVDTEGTCGLLFAETGQEIYELYDGIRLFSKQNKTNFYADALRWNAKTEQLISGRTDSVKLEKDGTVIVGTGFSASGVSGKFAFTGAVSGNIETKSQEDSSADSENHNQEKTEE